MIVIFLDLVIDLIVIDPSHDVFLKSCQLAKALLHGGNEEVQMSFYYRLREKNVSGKFFKAFITKFQTAQNRLKSDMMSGRDTRSKGGQFLFPINVIINNYRTLMCIIYTLLTVKSIIYLFQLFHLLQSVDVVGNFVLYLCCKRLFLICLNY